MQLCLFRPGRLGGPFPGDFCWSSIFQLELVSWPSVEMFPCSVFLILGSYWQKKFRFASKQKSQFLHEHQAQFLWAGVTSYFKECVFWFGLRFLQSQNHFRVRLFSWVAPFIGWPSRGQLRSALFWSVFSSSLEEFSLKLVFPPPFHLRQMGACCVSRVIPFSSCHLNLAAQSIGSIYPSRGAWASTTCEYFGLRQESHSGSYREKGAPQTILVVWESLESESELED